MFFLNLSIKPAKDNLQHQLCRLIVSLTFYKIRKFKSHVTRNDIITASLPKTMETIGTCGAGWNQTKYTILQNKIMRRCGVPPPPPIIFERLKLLQQIIYRRKENLSKSPNHKKYWKNILVSRFYEQFLRNRRNLGHFRKFEKISNS